MNIEIRALTPELENAYFDNRAFSDDSPYYPCYCNAFNMSAVEIREELHKHYAKNGKIKFLVCYTGKLDL